MVVVYRSYCYAVSFLIVQFQFHFHCFVLNMHGALFGLYLPWFTEQPPIALGNILYIACFFAYLINEIAIKTYR